MKLLSWNIDIFNNNTAEIIDIILEEDPDIICLQEVLAGLERNVHKETRR
jgi:exonuclease III